MNNYITIAKKQLEVFAGNNPTSPRIASIAAAIAQAEAAERQAAAMEKTAAILDAIASPQSDKAIAVQVLR